MAFPGTSERTAREAPSHFREVRATAGFDLYVVGGAGHDFRHRAHQRAHRKRQLDAAGVHRRLAVRASSTRICSTIARDSWSAAGRLVQMAVEMLLHLALGFSHEAEADAVADAPCREADCERAGVPERIQQAGTRIERLETLGGPREMIFFLDRGAIRTRPATKAIWSRVSEPDRAPARTPRRRGSRASIQPRAHAPPVRVRAPVPSPSILAEPATDDSSATRRSLSVNPDQTR